MMKYLSLVLNIVLLAAVGYLFYVHFSGKGHGSDLVKKEGMPFMADSNCFRSPIAYVELDSLNENISFIKNKRKELEAEQKAIETEWENGYKGLQATKDNFLKKGAAITQDEYEKFQLQLMDQQQQIDGKKQSLNQKLGEKSFNIMEDIQRKLKEFLAEYNNEKKYVYILTTGSGQDYMAFKDTSFNITKDVIKGMNIKLKSAGK